MLGKTPSEKLWIQYVCLVINEQPWGANTTINICNHYKMTIEWRLKTTDVLYIILYN